MKQILLCSTQLPFTSNHNLLKWSNVTVANTRYKFNTFAKQNKNGWNMAKLKGQCSPFPSFYGCVPNQSDGNKPDCKLGIAPVISKQVTKSRLWHQYSWNNSTQFSEESYFWTRNWPPSQMAIQKAPCSAPQALLVPCLNLTYSLRVCFPSACPPTLTQRCLFLWFHIAFLGR